MEKMDHFRDECYLTSVCATEGQPPVERKLEIGNGSTFPVDICEGSEMFCDISADMKLDPIRQMMVL